MNLEGKVAVITGSAVRIGQSVALALADAGADICIHYHTSAQAAGETCNEIRQRGRKAISVSADLSQPVSAAETIFSAVMSELGRVDVLINSASVFKNRTLKEATATDWDSHLDINLKAPFFLCQKFAELLSSSQSGHIINIVDWRARRAGIGHLPYRISKAGLVTLTECLALELAPEIQVNAIAPGAILPPPGEDQSYLDQRAAGVPLKRAGNPAEICQAVLYLLHSDFVTGEVLTVSGGEQFTAGA